MDRQIKLSDLFNPCDRLTVRALRIRLRNLPPESAFKTAVRIDAPKGDGTGSSTADDYKPENERWSRLEMLVADLIDRVTSLQHSFLQANGAKKLPKEPPRVRRPGVNTDSERRRVGLTPEAAAHLFKSMNPKGGDHGGQ